MTERENRNGPVDESWTHLFLYVVYHDHIAYTTYDHTEKPSSGTSLDLHFSQEIPGRPFNYIPPKSDTKFQHSYTMI